MIRWIVLIACGLIVWQFIKGDRARKEKKQEKHEAKLKATGQLVKDPVCGTWVSKDAEIRVKQGEKLHRFCSYECREKYLKQIDAGQQKTTKDDTTET